LLVKSLSKDFSYLGAMLKLAEKKGRVLIKLSSKFPALIIDSADGQLTKRSFSDRSPPKTTHS